jgi:threonine/homoserine/homoserine lactone efflux protein
MLNWRIGKISFKSIRMDIIIKGVLSGIVLAFLIGPVFFTLLQTSIERGFSSGVFVAIGISLSDSFYIFISYFGLTQFMQAENFRLYMAYGGAVILMLFGIYYLFIKSKKLARYDPEKVESASGLRLAAKGFLINGLSPMVLFFWLATVSLATTQLGYNSNKHALIFFSSIVCTVFVTDVIKAKLADKLRTLITPRFIRVMNIVLGIVMVVFAGKLILFPDNI